MMVQPYPDFLLKTQNADGGWGARTGLRSNTEATALAVLALSHVGDQAPATSIDHGLDCLVARQDADGSWPLSEQVQAAAWTTALAVLCLSAFDEHRQRALRGARWLLGQEGRDLGWVSSLLYRWAPQRLAIQLNPDLKGWSWTANAFSWVEPTAYALLALKKLSPFLHGTRAEARIHQGEQVIYDRMCKGGGWNYGNSTVLGEDLWPYPDITALALIALQDHQAVPANQQSLHALRTMLTQVQSGLTLSWAIICLTLYGQDASAWKNLLATSYEQTGFLGETKTIALALLASADGATVFRV